MKSSALLLLSTLAIASLATAQPPPDQPGARDPARQAARATVRKFCQDDMKSFCPDKRGGQMMMCLRSNHDKLSSDCQKAMAQLPPTGQQPPAQN